MAQSYVKVAAETHTGQDLEAIYEREIYELEMVDSFQDLLYHKVLRLGGKRIKGLPNSIVRLEQLAELQLEENDIAELPLTFGQLNVRALFLHHNYLRLLPETFPNLSLLEHLRLDSNQLTALPDNFGDLRALLWLELQNNKLVHLPDSFCKLTKLQRLKMEDNQLVGLPTDFGQLESLEALVVTNNRIEFLPPSFCELRSLQHLSIELNCISHLPDDFGKLESLETLFIGGNRLLSLPPTFGMLKSLQQCSLGPLNRFRVTWPRMCWVLGLGSINFKMLAPCDTEAAPLLRRQPDSDSDEDGPSAEIIGRGAAQKGTDDKIS